MAEASDVLRSLLKASSDSVKLGACRAMLELGVKLRESVELAEKLAVVDAGRANVVAQTGRIDQVIGLLSRGAVNRRRAHHETQWAVLETGGGAIGFGVFPAIGCFPVQLDTPNSSLLAV
jgi:hypothetical protein